jgi:DNA-binding Lrp family transcriptional regulator
MGSAPVRVAVDPADLHLLNGFQHAFPLVARPFDAIASSLGREPGEVMATCRRLLAAGVISRVGAVFAPRRAGAGTLAALACPPGRIEAVASIVSASPHVNHNYERTDPLNLWFVATAREPGELDAVLTDLDRRTGCRILRMPLEREYRIDLGFDLTASRGTASDAPDRRALRPFGEPQAVPGLQRALQDGMQITARPYQQLARRAGLDEASTLRILANWLAAGFVKRFGFVVRHHELGFTANAMCVWNVPDDLVDALGERLGTEPGITLCYRRARAASWPFNLYAMIHGCARAAVDARLAELSGQHALARFDGRVLYSVRRFKQGGARYLNDTPGRADGCLA